MRKKHIIHILIIVIFTINISLSYAFWASSINGNNISSTSSVAIGVWDFETIVSTSTDFEDVTKGSYAAGEITTYGYTWKLDDALIGTISSDLKNDLKSVRLRNGVLESLFSIENMTNISFVAGRFGSDSLGTLFIELSLDQNTWYTYESFVVTESLISYNISFTESGLASFGLSNDDMLFLRFRSNDSNRINIDDLSIGYTEIINDEFSFFEDFENASKAAYALDTIEINGLDWVFNDALIGSLSGDQKNDSKSIRLRNGYVSTLFSVENIEEISFYYGNYSQSLSAANLELELSSDGITWYLIDTISSTSSFDLYSITLKNTLLNPFGLSIEDSLYIRLSSDDSTRINIDDFTITYQGIDSFNNN